MKPLTKHILISICLLFTILNGAHLFKGGILFHEDIARDFIILDELVSEKKLTLIGPRIFSLPGMFHGPLWYYINLPVFSLFQGDPFVMGLYWFLLYHIGIIVFGVYARKISDDEVALFAVTILMGITSLMDARLWQASLSIFISTPFLYYVAEYLNTKKYLLSCVALFLLGCLIQSQLAFGGPIALLTLLILGYFWLKNKLYSHFSALLFLLLALSTYLLFDLRHDFLQFRSLLHYIEHSDPYFKFFRDLWPERFFSILEFFQLMRINFYSRLFGELPTFGQWLLQVFSAHLGIAGLALLHFRQKELPKLIKIAWWVSCIYVIGYWIVIVPFRGIYTWYYSEPFIPIICFWWSYTAKLYRSKIYFSIILGFIFLNLTFATNTVSALFLNSLTYRGTWRTHWDYYLNFGEKIMQDSRQQEFGYFAWSEKHYTYQFKYLMLFLEKKRGIRICDFCKKPLTYLILDPDELWIFWEDEPYWINQRVRISRPPDYQWQDNNTGFLKNPLKVYRYNLSAEEVMVEHDSLLDPRAHER